MRRLVQLCPLDQRTKAQHTLPGKIMPRSRAHPLWHRYPLFHVPTHLPCDQALAYHQPFSCHLGPDVPSPHFDDFPTACICNVSMMLWVRGHFALLANASHARDEGN